MFVFPLLFQLATAVHPPLAPRDSAALLKRVKDAQFRFIMDWRYQIQWDLFYPMFAEERSLPSRHRATPPRVTVTGVPGSEYDATSRVGALKAPRGGCAGHPHEDIDQHLLLAHLIRNPHNPVLYVLCPRLSRAPLLIDEPGLTDRQLSVEAQDTIRTLRTALLKRLDSAAMLLPGDRWIVGQRARFYLDQGDLQAAHRVSKGCRADSWWCSALSGYVLTTAGDWTAATKALSQAHAQLPPDVRTQWENIEYLLPYAGRKAYAELAPPARDSLNAIAWWLADPLFLEDGNDRLAEQMLRRFLVELHNDQIDLWRDWRKYYQGPMYVEMVLRYGWPPSPFSRCGSGMTIGSKKSPWPIKFRRFDTRATFLGCGSSAAAYPGPQFHSMPNWEAIRDPFHMTAANWDLAPARDVADFWDLSWWATEFYVRRAGPLVPVEYQVAMLRRQSTPLFAAAMQWDSLGYTFPRAEQMIGGAIFMTGPSASPAGARDTSSAQAHRLSGPIAPGMAVASLEMLPRDGIGAAGQSRVGITAPPPLSEMRAGEISVSDPVLVGATEGQAEPRAFGDMFGRMLATTTLRNPARVGVYWEVYGLADGDTVDVAIKLIRQLDANSPRRGILGFRRSVSDSVAVVWTEPRRGDPAATVEGGVAIRPRGVVLGSSHLTAGRYTLEVTLHRGSVSTRARRELTIVRR